MPDGVFVTLIKAFVMVNGLMLFFAFMTVFERKLLGRLQTRHGPNRVGPMGLLQPIADLGKLVRKQNVIPDGAHRRLYLAAPFISMFAALASFAVIPFGAEATIPGTDFTISLSIADSNVALLYVAAIGSMGFYGMLIGGWASGSKYALLGGLRAVAQLVSYEVAFTLAIIGVVLQAGTLSLQGIVNAQVDYPYIVPQILGFAIFYLAALAECNRPPFDLAEADGEIVAGLPHRVRRHALRDVRERRVRRGHRALGARCDAFPGRLARPAAVRAVHVDPRPDLADRQHLPAALHVHLGARNGAPAALRPPHEVRLEGAAPARHPQPARDRRLGGAELMGIR